MILKRYLKKMVNECIVIVLMILSFKMTSVEKVFDCDNALTTLEIKLCAYTELEQRQAELSECLEASFKCIA